MRISIYEVFVGVSNQITRELNRMICYTRELVEQNAVLRDEIADLVRRDDPKKVSGRNRLLHNPEKGEDLLHSGSAAAVDEIRRSDARRRIHSAYRQAG